MLCLVLLAFKSLLDVLWLC